MKYIYFVTEGPTDQIVIEGLIGRFFDKEDFVSRRIQPPTSAYAEGLETNLSDGWKGVLAWCEGRRAEGPAGRDEAIRLADCLVIHTDADVATDADFANPAFGGPCPPARNAANWVRNHIAASLGGQSANVVLCVPAQDLETWILCALHPEIADEHLPVECREEPGALLVQRAPHRLVRRKDGRLKKETAKYRTSLPAIVGGWSNCTEGEVPRCGEAVRFENEVRGVLGV